MLFFLICHLMILSLAGCIPLAEGTNIYVNSKYTPMTAGWKIDHFQTIQEAINNASSGDIINISSGLYPEHITVNKSLRLIGGYNGTTIINGDGTGDILSIVSDNTWIENITIQNSGKNSTDAGLKIHSNNNVIKRVTAINNALGILLNQSKNNSIFENTIYGNIYGIGIENCIEITISKNYIYKNNITGIYIARSQNNIVNDNTINNQQYGLALRPVG